MYLGVAKIKITPESPVRLCGYATRTSEFAGIKEDIYLRVQVHKNNNEKIAFIYADILWWGSDFVKDIKPVLVEKFGFKFNNIFFVASHNHSGPPNGENFTSTLETYDQNYASFLKEKVIQAVNTAFDNVEKVTGILYRGKSNLNVFRRVMVDGEVHMAPNYEVSVDRNLTIVGLYKEDGSLKGLMIHYPCHANLSDQNYIQPDFPGVVLRMLDKEYTDSVSIFLQGCTADIRPNVVLGDKFSPCTYEKVLEFANSFYEDCCNTLKNEAQPLKFNINTIKKEVKLYQENLIEIEEIEEVKNSKSIVEGEWAEKVLEKGNRGYEVMEINKIEYADKITFLTFNGEISQYYSKFAKSLESNTISIGYTNGMIGYISTKEQILEGGYEPKDSALYFALSGTYKPEIEEVIQKAMKKLLAK